MPSYVIFICPGCEKQYARYDGTPGISLDNTYCPCRSWSERGWPGWKQVEVVPREYADSLKRMIEDLRPELKQAREEVDRRNTRVRKEIDTRA